MADAWEVVSFDPDENDLIDVLCDFVIAGVAEIWEEVSVGIVALDVSSDEVTGFGLAEVTIVGDVESINLLSVSEERPGVAAEILLGFSL